METRVNEGVDPSASLLDSNYSPELVYKELAEDAGISEPEAQHTEESVFADDMIPIVTPAVRVRVEPRAVDMDDMMRALETPHTAPHETADEQGIPEDYGENGATDTGILEEPGAQVASPQIYSAYGRRVVPREDMMNMFRSDKDGTAFLTRNYDSAEGDWGEFVLNVSVNEALRTRGKDAETVIEKELSQIIAKKVWTPVDKRGLSVEEM